MGTGIGHTIDGVIMGQEGIVGIGGESKLKDLHPGQVEGIPHLCDPFGDHAEILSDDRQVAHFFFDHFEKVLARSLDPATFHGRLVAKGDFPIGLKAAEMVQTDDIHLFEHSLEP